MKRISLVVLIAFLTTPAFATLEVIGTATYNGNDYNLIYDVEDQITWLDYSRPGTDYYSGSVNWAASLNNPGELVINLDEGYSANWDSSQWELPQIDGYRISSGNVFDFENSSIYDLYYNELGNIEDDPTINTGPFDNLVTASSTSSWYWLEPTFDTGVTYKPGFNFATGKLHRGYYGLTVSVNGGIQAMATISGAVVPEPASICILAFGGMMLRRPRRR